MESNHVPIPKLSQWEIDRLNREDTGNNSIPVWRMSEYELMNNSQEQIDAIIRRTDESLARNLGQEAINE
jgi:hypothetical protein